MDTLITRAEHEEFRRRLEEENRRQDRRIEILEENVLEMGQLTATVAKLAVNMENMLKVQGQQEERLKTLEGRDGELWRRAVGYAVTAVISIVIGWVFARLGM